MAGNTEHTFIDPQAVRTTAGHIGGLLDDMQAFHTVAGIETRAGDFETATWLEELVRDRQAGLLRHAVDLKAVLGDIKESLGQVTQTFEETDQRNGANLERRLGHEVNVLQINAFHHGGSAAPPK